jgi:hypothetical protein
MWLSILLIILASISLYYEVYLVTMFFLACAWINYMYIGRD